MTGPAATWTLIAALGAGTYLIRLSFLGLLGRRPLPAFVERHLRYTAVAVLPGLVAPLVLFPEATGGEPDAARAIAAVVTLALGWRSRSVLWAMIGGAAALYLVLGIQAAV